MYSNIAYIAAESTYFRFFFFSYSSSCSSLVCRHDIFAVVVIWTKNKETKENKNNWMQKEEKKKFKIVDAQKQKSFDSTSLFCVFFFPSSLLQGLWVEYFIVVKGREHTIEMNSKI